MIISSLSSLPSSSPDMKIVLTSSLVLLSVLCLSQTYGAKITEETKTLDQLYADALAEGGNLAWYSGGDTPTQQDATESLFSQQFPKITSHLWWTTAYTTTCAWTTSWRRNHSCRTWSRCRRCRTFLDGASRASC